MKFILYTLALAGIAFLSWQLFRQYAAYQSLERQLAGVELKLAPLTKENGMLADNLKSLEGQDAQLRELRRAGYAAPGEKVFVIIPKK